MEIVINIDGKLYDYMKSLRYNSILENIVLAGTILPKGHGRLIDFDTLVKNFDKCTCAENCNFITCPVYSPKVIIEADKEIKK